MTDHGRAGTDGPHRTPPGPAPVAPRPPGTPGHRRRGARLTVGGVGVAVVVLGVLIGVAALAAGGDGARRRAELDARIGSAIVQVDPEAPEPTRTEPGGRDQLLLLSALVTGTGVLLVGAATSARRARRRRSADAGSRPG